MQIKKLLIFALIFSSNFCCWAKSNDSSDLDKLLKQMRKQTENENFNGVVQCVSEAFKIKPDFGYAYHYYGVANFYLNRYANSLFGFTELLRLDPESYITYGNRGGVYVCLGYDSHALLDFEYALEGNDRDGITYLNRSNVYINNGDFGAARHDLDLAEEYLGISVELYCNRASLALFEGNKKEALHFCDIALKDNPKYAIGIQTKLEILNLIGSEKEKKNFANQVISLLQNNIRKIPSDYNSYHSLGMAQLILGDFEKAVCNLQMADILLSEQITLFPDSYTLIYQRACVYELMGNVHNAKKDFERAKEINPKYPPLEEKLKRL